VSRQKKEQEEPQDKLITAAQVAEIWNERARAMGYANTNYTRFSVRQRRNAKKTGSIKPVLETSVGGLYKESDARKIQIYPERSRPEPKPTPETSKDSSQSS
jgi:hypothetical protein